jgi:small subunit ribosomal protein S16
VAQSTAGRNGKFVETIGTYDPIVKPTRIEVNAERALHWLRIGAQPTETTAYLLNKIGILETYFQERPGARKNFSFLDKRTPSTSVKSVVDHEAPAAPAAAPAKAAKEAPVAEAVAAPVEEPAVVEAPVEEAPAATEEAPVTEAADTSVETTE